MRRLSSMLASRSRVARTGTSVVLVCCLLAALSASSASAIQEPFVQVIGCSNSSRIFSSYDHYSSRHAAVNSAAGGASLSVWAKENTYVWKGGNAPAGYKVPGFDPNYAAYGATAVWYPLCIAAGDYGTGAQAYNGFKLFEKLLRKRTSAPLYLSPSIGEQPWCGNAQTQQAYVTDHALADGLALRGPDIPPGSVPTNEDGCHFDPILSTNIAEVTLAFLDGATLQPSISSFTPASAPVGTSVTIIGSGFTDATSVAFNGTYATYAVVSGGEISTAVPSGATTGPIAVTTASGTATSAANFTVVDPSGGPWIESFTPGSGPVGASVTITGYVFTGTTSVTFNGAEAGFSVVSDGEITAVVPTGATTGPIAVTTGDGTATSSSSFMVTVPPPSIASFTPGSGPVGTWVSITGTGFTGASAVTFGGASASFTVDSDTQITASVPTGAVSGPIAVTTPGGTATSSSSFMVAGGASLPVITSFTPTSGKAGTSVTISGSGFTGATSVKFNGTSATFTVDSDAKITTTVPSGAKTGPISVTTPGGTATSPSPFKVAAK